MPEYLQNKATVESITNKAFEMINSEEKKEKLKSELFRVKEKLQDSDVSQRVAENILSLVDNKWKQRKKA